MNDAPRRLWNILDKGLHSYGMIPTRADRCCYVLYSTQPRERTWKTWEQGTHQHDTKDLHTELHQRSKNDVAFEKNAGS